jgi:hypothetical protein
MKPLLKFFSAGSPLITTAVILKRTTNAKFKNPENLIGEALPIGTFGRVHSKSNGTYTVWLLNEDTMQTVILEVPLHMMGAYFCAHPHGIFPHLA